MAKPPIILDPECTFRNSFHLATSTIFLDGPVETEMASFTAKALHLLSQKSEPITVYLCTRGGNRASSLGIYDLLRTCPNPVTVIGYGEVLSSGVVILQGGDLRVLHSNTSVMVHPGHSQTGFDLDANTIQVAKELVRERDLWYGILAKRMGIPLADMLSNYTWDTYMTARKAVKLGLADRVI